MNVDEPYQKVFFRIELHCNLSNTGVNPGMFENEGVFYHYVLFSRGRQRNYRQIQDYLNAS
jgi:hypothetical protein